MWYEGDRVWVPRITTDESHELVIKKFMDDEEVADPDVLLRFREIRPMRGSTMKSEITREQMHFAKLSELEEVPSKRTKGGALRRKVRGMVAVICECGCEQETSGGRFRQGHDAKLKSKLRRIMDGRIESPDMSPAEAEAELRERQWLS